jgi:iron complex outermembrane receptor protein
MKSSQTESTLSLYFQSRALALRLAAACLAGLITLTSPVFAQATAPATKPASNSTETVELSPFVVAETGETGWVATETIAGTRLRTSFKDVPNQLETLTKEFMQDLGVTHLADAQNYTAHSESTGEYNQGTVNDAQFPASPGRMRSLGDGTLSRNFFPTRSPTDNYNIDRATVASGPNAILFGLGSPSGILDATPARALMRNRYGFTLLYDSEDSKRGTFDANAVILPDKLSLRLIGLSKKTYTEKKPNFDRDDRIFGALSFKPFANTTLTVQGERINRAWNRPSRTTPFDFVTPWLYADQIPGSVYTTAKPVYDNTSFAGIANNRIFAQAGEQPIMISGEGDTIRSWRNSVTVKSPGTLPGVDPTFDAGASFTLLDPSIFPFDVNVLGLTRANVLDGQNKTVTLEQKLADNLFLELAYNFDKSNNLILAAGGNPSGSNIRLLVDANRLIPGTTTPNPHVGEYYVQGTSANRLQFFDREDWRGTLSYVYDAARKLGERSAWMKWLGRHRLLGLFSISQDEAMNQNTFQRRILDDPVLPGVTLRPKTFQNWANHATRTPQYRHYLGNPYEPNRAFGPLWGDWTLKDANGNPYQLYYIDTPLRATDGKRLGAQAAASGVKNKSSAQVFVWQAFLLPDRLKRDRLVLTYGYRKDAARTATLDGASTTQDFSGLFPVLWDTEYDSYGAKESGTTRNIGVVARPLPWLSLSYNKSTTFDLSLSRYDPFGTQLPGSAGEGRDYGVRIDLWGDKLSLKVNRYENTLGPTRAIQQINNYTNQFANVENRVAELDPSVARINITDGNRRGFPLLGTNNYNINSDASAKGYEAELNFRPNRNWNFRLNGSKGESTETNIGSEWFKWLEQRLPVWQGVVAKNGEMNAAGQPVTWNTAPYDDALPNGQTLAQYYQSQVVGQALAFIQAVDGRSNPGVRNGRVNVIANYRFNEGRLKGLSVGGALRYRGAAIIGYGIRTNEFGATVLDLDRAYKGEAERFVDFMAGYRGRIKFFGGINYRLQLNVRNLLNENDPVPNQALSTGAISQLLTVDSRLTSITFGVDF